MHARGRALRRRLRRVGAHARRGGGAGGTAPVAGERGERRPAGAAGPSLPSSSTAGEAGRERRGGGGPRARGRNPCPGGGRSGRTPRSAGGACARGRPTWRPENGAEALWSGGRAHSKDRKPRRKPPLRTGETRRPGERDCGRARTTHAGVLKFPRSSPEVPPANAYGADRHHPPTPPSRAARRRTRRVIVPLARPALERPPRRHLARPPRLYRPPSRDTSRTRRSTPCSTRRGLGRRRCPAASRRRRRPRAGTSISTRSR